MKNNITELVFILDKSGSMSGLEADTIGGFNSMIAKQKKEDGICYVSTILFNHTSEVIHDRKNLCDILPMTNRDYIAGGSTALLDAVGDAVKHIEMIHKYARPEDIPAHTMFIITTDGMENASRRYSHRDIKKLIEKKKEEDWEFLFLGANIDAVEAAESIGINADRAVNYNCDAKGTALNYEVLNETVACFRAAAPIGASWKSKIERDHKKRGRR